MVTIESLIGKILKKMDLYQYTIAQAAAYNNKVKELKDSAVLVGRVRPGLVVTQGMLREVKADPDNFERSRKFMNILGDKPETVAPYLIDRMLAMKASGGKIAWLSGPKIAKRFALARLRPRPDLFAEAGL